MTCEKLRREKLLFETRTGPYGDNDTIESRFITNVEELLSTENVQWKNTWEKEPAVRSF